jgi:hypothetical protein
MSDRSSASDFVKVRLTDAEGRMTETVWATRVGPDRFKVDNVPWLAYRVSLGDIVQGTEYAPDMYEFVRVVEPSGNRAIRLVLGDATHAKTPAGKAILDGLIELGCGYEGANPRYIGVTVPPAVDLASVADYLVAAGVTWEYANPTWDDLFAPGSG